MTDQEVTLGEIYRSLQRLEAALIAHLADSRTRQLELTDKLESIAPLSVRVSVTEARLDKLEPKVDSSTVYAAWVAGGVAAIVFLVQVLWK